MCLNIKNMNRHCEFSDLKGRFPKMYKRIISNLPVTVFTFHDDRLLIIDLLNCKQPLVFTADELEGIEAVLS